MNEDKIRRFTEWLAEPPEERVPKTQKELALELGVKESQLSIWKKELELQSAPPSEITQFMKYVWEGVKAGKNPMWARIYWDIKNPAKKELKEAGFTADDYINIGTELKERLQDGYREGAGSCPVCGRPKTSGDEPRLDTEPEHKED